MGDCELLHLSQILPHRLQHLRILLHISHPGRTLVGKANVAHGLFLFVVHVQFIKSVINPNSLIPLLLLRISPRSVHHTLVNLIVPRRRPWIQPRATPVDYILD